MILRTTLVTLASFSIRCQQSVGVTCYPQVCFGSVTMWHARSLKPVSPSGQRCLVTPGWNLPLQVWPVPYQRRVLVHEWVRSAIHSSPQLTSPMVSYLWNFHHCLVQYYWYVTVCFGILLHALVWFDLILCLVPARCLQETRISNVNADQYT